MAKAPQALASYASLIRHLAFGSQNKPGGNVALVPSTVQQLAHRAERTPQFAAAAAALFPERNSPEFHAPEILRRSGFYNATLTTGARAPKWGVISRRIVPHRITITRMLLLDLCWFAQEQFRIGEYAVRKHSREEIKQLGPGNDVTDSFYQRERLDPEWFSGQWFLETSKTSIKRPGRLTLEFPQDIVLDDHWRPVLILCLYSPVCLQVPVVVENHQNWKLAIRKFSHPQVDYVGEGPEEVPYRFYKVEEPEWPAFQKFCRGMQADLEVCHEWGRIKIAARRFLRATFLSAYDGTAWGGDDADDVLLQYVFALEALLNTGDREAISEKVAVRTALLAGRTDEERLEMKRIVKAAYTARSELAHGRTRKAQVNLAQLRDVCRRSVTAGIAIAANCPSEKMFAGVLDDSLVSNSVQKDLQARSKSTQRLMRGWE